jgi:hypothetical protein
VSRLDDPPEGTPVPHAAPARLGLPPRGHKFIALQDVPKDIRAGTPDMEDIVRGWFETVLTDRGLHHHPDCPEWTLEWIEVSESEAAIPYVDDEGEEFFPYEAGDWHCRGYTYVLEAPEGDT